MKSLTKTENGYVIEVTFAEYRILCSLQDAIKGNKEYFGFISDYREINSDMAETFAAIRHWVMNKFSVNAIEQSMRDARKALGEDATSDQ